MISRSPENSIAASVVFNATKWPCTFNNGTCPQDFVMDASNSICYLVLTELTSRNSDNLCPESTIVQFYNDAEIIGFVNILKSGSEFRNVTFGEDDSLIKPSIKIKLFYNIIKNA